MSECGVCIGGNDYDGMAEMRECITPRARKAHKCCECLRIIQPGERYERWSGRFDGDFFSQKTCHQCAEIRNAFTCGGSWTTEALWSEMEYIVFPVLTTANECFKKLSPPAKEFLLAKWRKWKGLE